MWWLMLTLTITFSNLEQTFEKVVYDSYQTSAGCIQAGSRLTSSEMKEWYNYWKPHNKDVMKVVITNQRCNYKSDM